MGLSVTAIAVTAALLAIAPPSLEYPAGPGGRIADFSSGIPDLERIGDRAPGIIPGAEKRIRWYSGQVDSRTSWSVVYLHGFSATRQEIAPVGEMIADQMNANLFETRLAGHGRVQSPLEGVRAEDWLDDGVEALMVGAAIGEKIVLIGTSTGATLALALANLPGFDRVAGLVLISPNFAPRDPAAEFLTWPGGPQLAELLEGDTQSWTPANDLQGRFWSTSYPMAAVVEMMRLVKFARMGLPLTLDASVLIIYSPADTVIDVNRILTSYPLLRAPRKKLLEIETSGDQSNHVLAGNILAPENNELLTREVVQFIYGDSKHHPDGQDDG
jgi:alpha-beta hydrolase superfamily lysophospholipase